jgi:hypothetical protein
MDLIATIGAGLGTDFPDLGTQYQTGHFGLELVRQLSGLAHQFPGDISSFPVLDLNKHSHNVSGSLGLWFFFFAYFLAFALVKGHSFHRTNIRALAAAHTNLGIYAGHAIRGQFNGSHRAFTDTDLTAYALVR